MIVPAFALLAGIASQPMAVPPAPVAARTAPIVIGQAHRFRSAALGEERVVNVWLPPSYGQAGARDRRYPVIYLLDGGLAQDFHHMSGLAQLGALSWQTQEFIVVGVETVDRRRELAFPIERDAALRQEYPTAGGAAAFRRFLTSEVKPLIESRYRVSGEDALLGESLAGLFIVETFLRAPEDFDSFVAIDPSLWWDGGRLTEEAAGLLARHGPEHKRLWLSAGYETLHQPANLDRLRTALQARPVASLDFRDEPRMLRNHANIYHPTAYEALQALYPRAE